MVRLGRSNDGGYIIHDPDSECRIVYSIDICDDVSWDLDMVKYGYDIFQYDHTIKKLPLINEHFHWFKVGLTGKKETTNLKCLDTLIKENGHQSMDSMILKMDIEGAEWDVLENISEEVLLKFEQIVMEIHYIWTGNRKKIISGLKKLVKNHYLIHIHANNNGIRSVNRDLITPEFIEVSFIRKDKINDCKTSNDIFPKDFDEPCTLRFPDIFMGKWNINC